jgi:hypothetical protein
MSDEIIINIEGDDNIEIDIGSSPVLSVNGKTGDVVLVKDDVGLDQVDNTSDLDKPLSTAATNAFGVTNTNINYLSAVSDNTETNIRYLSGIYFSGIQDLSFNDNTSELSISNANTVALSGYVIPKITQEIETLRDSIVDGSYPAGFAGALKERLGDFVYLEYKQDEGWFVYDANGLRIALSAASDTIYQDLTSNWNSVYNNVNSLSSFNESVYNNVNILSSFNESVYNNVNSLSSFNESVYNNVNSLSSNWDSAYNITTKYQNTSASFATYQYVNSEFLPLSGGNVSGDLIVDGSFYVTGSAVYINVADFQVEDALVYFGITNPSDLLDIGIIGVYRPSGDVVDHRHTGLIRNHQDKKWILFSNLSACPLSGIGPNPKLNDPSIVIDTLKANIEGNLTTNTTVSGNLTTLGTLNVEKYFYENEVVAKFSRNVQQAIHILVSDESFTTGNPAPLGSIGADVEGFKIRYGNDLGGTEWGEALYLDKENDGEIARTKLNLGTAAQVASGVFAPSNLYQNLTGNWNSVYNNVNVLSSNWDSVYNNVNSLSGNWNYQGTDLKALSGNWDSVYNNVNALSGNWNYQGTDLKALSGNWQTTYQNAVTSVNGEVGKDILVKKLTTGNFDDFSTAYNGVEGFFIAKTKNTNDGCIGIEFFDTGGNRVAFSILGSRGGDSFLQGNSDTFRIETAGGGLANLRASGLKSSNFNFSFPSKNGTLAVTDDIQPIIPTVTNYLSTNNVQISSLNVFDRFVVDNQLYYTTDSKVSQLSALLGNYDEGLFLGKNKLTQNNTRLINVGNTWTTKESTRSWYGIAMSSDGKYQTAVVTSGQIYISSDYGNTWVAKDSNRIWRDVAMSSDGKYQTVVVFNGQIYISSDYGNTWTTRESIRSWNGIAMSSDGKYQTAVVDGGQIYISSDYGNTWVVKESSRFWYGIAMSSDGKYQTVVVFNGQIYISSDYGNTWVVKESTRSWRKVAMSSDGKYQTAVVDGGQIYISSDYGNNWVAKDSNRFWFAISMSSDGKYQTAVASGGQIYISSNYGNTWVAKESNRSWNGIAMSSDGKYQTAVADASRIYVSVADEYIEGNLTINGTISTSNDLNVSGTISNSQFEFIDKIPNSSNLNTGTRLYISNGGATGVSQQINSQQMFLAPIWIPTDSNIDLVGSLAAANASNVDLKICIYNATENGLPRTRVSDVFTVPTGITSGGEIIGTSTNFNLKRGNYWAAIMASGSNANVYRSVPGNTSNGNGQLFFSGLYRVLPGSIDSTVSGHLITAVSSGQEPPSDLSSRTLDWTTSGGVGVLSTFRNRQTAPFVFFRIQS